MSRNPFALGGVGPWQQRLATVVETVRAMSTHTDPEEMVNAYSERVSDVSQFDRFCSLSRRKLDRPYVRITRSDMWQDHPNPWKETSRLPLLNGGLFSDLIWGDEPVIINDLTALGLRDSDPAAEYFAGMRSLVAVPNYDKGHALNMVILMSATTNAYDPEFLPEQVWMSNLFGRATHNLVLASQVREAYDSLDRELQVVANIQRSLLPSELPKIPNVDLAAFYQTSQRAGGDYYDFFRLPGGKWGILIADVSGHGTPAAVIMAITHSIAHTCVDDPIPPSRLMNFVNQHLATKYTNGTGTFVTAFYGILDPAKRELTYANAGHPAPRIRRADGSVHPIMIDSQNESGGLPLGIEPDEKYQDVRAHFNAGDLILFYTDGINEARAESGEMFEIRRIDEAIANCTGADHAIKQVTTSLKHFTGKRTASDDQTLVVAHLR